MNFQKFAVSKKVMERYKNLSRKSGILSFEIGTDYITVRFAGTGNTYTYSYRTAGAIHVEAMKRLALEGRGLATYISRHVKDLYD